MIVLLVMFGVIGAARQAMDSGLAAPRAGHAAEVFLPLRGGASPALTVSGSGATLETEAARLRIARGRLVSLVDKSRNVELVAGPTDRLRSVFRVILNNGFAKAQEVDASAMELRASETKDGELRLAFESKDLRVVMGVGSEGSDLTWRMEATPVNPALSVAAVQFPIVHLRAPLGREGAGDRVVFPRNEGLLIHDPLGGVGAQDPRRRLHDYPADMVAQFVGYFCDRSGCLLWTDDTAGHVKGFGFDRQPNEPGLPFLIQHRMPLEPGKTWRMPYRARISFFAGHWQAGAEIYRAWAAQQFWCKTPLRNRKDVSPLLHAPCLVIHSELRQERFDTLPDTLAAYAKRFNTPVIYRPVGWEKHGGWIGGDYFPPFPNEEGFRQLVAALRGRGIYLACFVSGRFWTRRAERASPATNEALKRSIEEQEVHRFAEWLREGRPWTRKFMGLEQIRLCAGTTWGRNFLFDTSRRLVDLGVTAVHEDQDLGPEPSGSTSCYNSAHGHPLPCGNWPAQAMLDWLTRIKQAGQARTPDFILTKEEDTELMNMVLMGYQTRYFHRLRADLPDRAAEIVPVTQYLYHEYLPTIYGFAGPGWEEVARSMVMGQIPSLPFWNQVVAPVEQLPAPTVALLEDYYAAMKRYAKPFLLYGRMTTAPPMNVPTVRRRVEKRTLEGQSIGLELDDPLVVTSSWRDEAGNLGVLGVNLTTAAVSVRGTVPRAAGNWVGLSQYVGASTVNVRRAVPPGSAFVWTLPPSRLCGLVFQVGK